MASKIKIGIFGAYRGASTIECCKYLEDVEIVAVCDKSEYALNFYRKNSRSANVAFYNDYDKFVKHDMDAIVLANHANEHAPFAIKALKSGKHVLSEVVPVQTMKEAVELVEAVETSGKIYAYGENYCYIPAVLEMKKLYRENKIGEFEYGECEYIHNCEAIWPSLTYGEESHWRNNMYSTFYCTHSIGPIIHITGLRPIKVNGLEGTKTERRLRTGAKGGAFGIEMITLENGGIIKSIHGGLYKNSTWYSIYGSLGRMECGREDADGISTSDNSHLSKLYITYDEFSGGYETGKWEFINPTEGIDDTVASFGHNGSDFYSINNFIEKIRGNEDADIIDVYEALDMFLPGMFAYRSILEDGKAMSIPNLRDIKERDKWRNDTACTDDAIAGNMILPTISTGTPDIEPEIYEYMKLLWEDDCGDGESEDASCNNI